MRTMISCLLLSLLVGCAGGSGSSKSDNGLAVYNDTDGTPLPPCTDVPASATDGQLPIIRHVAGTSDLYVLIEGTDVLCVGDFDQVADSAAARAGVIFESRDWASSNPMPGKGDSVSGSNPMPGRGGSNQTTGDAEPETKTNMGPAPQKS